MLRGKGFHTFPHEYLSRTLIQVCSGFSAYKVPIMRSRSVNHPARLLTNGKDVDFSTADETKKTRDVDLTVAVLDSLLIGEEVLHQSFKGGNDTFVPNRLEGGLRDVVLLEADFMNA